jgi:uncharacterized membrane protein required for colicin V production
VPLAERFIDDSSYAHIVSYIVVLCGTFFGVLLVLAILRNLFRMALLGGIDRFAGGLMGLVKGTVLCAIILMVLTAFLPSDSESLTHSKLAPRIHMLTSSMSSLLPETMREEVRHKGGYLHEMWNKDWAGELRKKHRGGGQVKAVKETSVQAIDDVIEALLGPEGCPWDRKQTPSSLCDYVIEEAYELLDGIRKDNSRDPRRARRRALPAPVHHRPL